MKQRLGIACSLIHNPRLVILDEPTNGLDPAGIHEMRDLIRRLPADAGVTVFLSSHLLSEVEQIASHIGIIQEGRLLFQGRLADLQKRQLTRLRIGTNQLDQAASFLTKAGWMVEQSDGMLNVAATTSEDAISINSLLVDRGIDVFHLSLSQASLEDIFLALTADQSAATKTIAA